MRIVFMGTPSIAAACLRRICADGLELVGVCTKPDTPQNRGLKLAMSEVKLFAQSAGLPVFQPATFRDDAAVGQLRSLKPDLILVVAYGKILPQRVLDIPPLGCVNIHASILPSLRGSAPVQWAILNGCAETGVTAMYMDAGMDTGDIIEIRKTPIGPTETSSELMDRLAVLGAELLSDTVRRIAEGTVTRTPQDDARATMAPMLTKEMAPIDWSRSGNEIVNHVRGLIPWPVATAELDGKRFKIFRVEPAGRQTNARPGTPLALTKHGLEIACGGGGVLTITQLQAEGGKRMAAPDYFRGHPIDL